MTSLLLFEPYLRDYGGHLNRCARVIAGECRRQEIKLAIACRNDIRRDLRNELTLLGASVLPVFNPISYRFGGREEARSVAAKAVAAVALECSKLLPDYRAIWLNANAVQIQAASLLSMTGGRPAVLRIIDFADDWPSGALSAPEYIRMELGYAVSGGLRVYAETAHIALRLEQELGVRVGVFPAVLDLRPYTPKAIAERPRVGFMNLLTGAKNPVFAIDALAAQGDRISTTLHMGQSTKSGFRAVLANVKYMARTIGLRNTMIQRTDIMTASALTHYFRHALRKNGCRRADFEIVPGAVSPDEYTALFRRLDCAILPYSVSWYSRKGSGVMFESLAEGIIPIAPLGTSMAALMQDAGVGVVYSAGDPEDFRNAIATMVVQFENLSRASQTYAPIYRASNSPHHALAILTCD